MANEKKQAWRWCAKYIKLRDAIEDFSITHDLDLVCCRTCSKWMKTNSKEAQASHFISRGLGGSSGVYFDERNIHICCYQCNCFKQGSPKEYEDFMRSKYGQAVIDELRLKDKTNIYKARDFVGMGLMYRELYEELLEGLI